MATRTIMQRLLDRVFGRAEEINGGERCPTYLFRWEVLSIAWRKRSARFYLHRFVGDDWSLDLHDHPKRFWSLGLWGKYIEARDDGTTREYRAPWIRTFAAEHRHRLTGPRPESPCWTLVIVGTPTREWGFWHAGRFIPWRRYVAPESREAAASLSCAGAAEEDAPWSVIHDGGRRPLDAVAAAARRVVRQEVLDTLSGLVAEFGAERAVAMLEETLFGTREEPS